MHPRKLLTWWFMFCPGVVWSASRDMNDYELSGGLERQIAVQLEDDLRREVEQTIISYTKNPSRGFDVRVRVGLGQDIPATNSLPLAEPSSYLSQIHVDVELEFLPNDPALDVVIRHRVREFFEYHGLVSGSHNPAVNISIRVAPQAIPADKEFLAMLTKILFAGFALIFVFLLNSRRKSRVVKPGVMPQHRVRSIPNQGEDQNKKAPTAAYLRAVQADLDLEVDPGCGSWYINSLPEASYQGLQTAFTTLPFEQARVVLRRMPRPARNLVLTRLDIAPAIKSRMDMTS